MILSRFQNPCELHWPETKGLLQRMVAINSFTTHVSGVNRVGKCVAEQFTRLGFSSESVPHPFVDYGSHLILRSPELQNAPTIALIAHLDTVFPEEEEARNHFVWREEGDRIYGPGTNDIKGGIAAIYLLLATMRDAVPDCFQGVNWVVLCNACEEIDSWDFGALCRSRLPADTMACLIFEADGGDGDAFSLVTSRNGRATFRVDVQGRGAHAGGQHARGANAITQIARIIGRLESLTHHQTGPTVNFGRVHGGTVLNRIPESAFAELEMRAFSPQIFEQAQERILAEAGEGDLRSLDADAWPCQIKVEQMEQTPPWPKNDASEHLFARWQAAGNELNLAVGSQHRGGLSDGNVIWNHFPTLDGLGPRGNFSHCSERDPAQGKEQEYVDSSSFVPKTVMNLTALVDLLGRPT